MKDDVVIDLQSPAIKEWQRNNARLAIDGYQLVANFFEDRAPEFWAVKGDEKIRNDPPPS